jgi:hypothetical protein
MSNTTKTTVTHGINYSHPPDNTQNYSIPQKTSNLIMKPTKVKKNTKKEKKNKKKRYF